MCVDRWVGTRALGARLDSKQITTIPHLSLSQNLTYGAAAAVGIALASFGVALARILLEPWRTVSAARKRWIPSVSPVESRRIVLVFCHFSPPDPSSTAAAEGRRRAASSVIKFCTDLYRHWPC